MKKKYVFVLFLAGCLAFMFILTSASGNGKINPPFADAAIPVPAAKENIAPPAGRVKVDLDFGNIPLYFITNKGQVNDRAKFYCKASRYTLWLTKEGLVFDNTRIRNQSKKTKDKRKKENLIAEKDRDRNPLPRRGAPKGRGGLEPTKFSRSVSRLLFVGANQNAGITAVEPAKLRVNYFRGNDKSKWYGNIPTSRAVIFQDLYKNIDLKVYGIEQQVEYDWIVKPGANPADIKIAYKNVKSTRIDREGNLVIDTKFGKLIHKKPVSYQEIEAGGESCVGAQRALPETNRKGLIHQTRRTVETQHLASQTDHVDVNFKKIGKNIYGFSVGDYDRTRELIIDPVVFVYSTYLGGAGSEYGEGIAVDNNANVYVTGTTDGTDFPVLDEYQTDQTGYDVFVSRIDTNQAGTASLIYSTYLGGSGYDEGGKIAVDNSGIIYVTGDTSSTDFPCLDQYQSNQTGDDAFITKIDTTQAGTAGLLYSTYLGGSGNDYGNSIAIDGSSCAYVAGSTSSTDFPTLNQYQADPGDSGFDAFVTKIDTTQAGASGLIYSTYLGGADVDEGVGIDVDAAGNIYVSGITMSSDFPCVNQYQLDQGEADAFVSRIDPAETGVDTLIYSTYLGGSSLDYGWDLALGSGGYVYVTGITDSTDFPTLSQYQSDQPGRDAFVTRLDTNQSGSTCLVYSTYLGGDMDDNGMDIAVENSGVVYVTGDTASNDFPCVNQYQANPDGHQYDAFISRVDTNRTGTSGLTFSTYLGGGHSDDGRGIAVDNTGYAYVTGQTGSTDFPLANEYQADQGLSDAYVARFLFSYLTLLSPNGGEEWGPGTVHDVTWENTGIQGNLKLTLWQNDEIVALISNEFEPGVTSYAWTVGECLTGAALPGSGYTIKIKEIGGLNSDSGDAPFTILPLAVTSPNGSELLTSGTFRDITWNAPGLSNNLKIGLLKDGAVLGLIADNVDPSTGSYRWSVGQYSGGPAAPGAGYKIGIKVKGISFADKSDVPFTILSPPTLTLTSPNGGEAWPAGIPRTITWTTTGIPGPVNINLYKDGVKVGTITDYVEAGIPFYSWNVGQVAGGSVSPGSGYAVRVRFRGTAIIDYSDAPFNILSTLSVTSPNGGEDWQLVTPHNITWVASADIDLLKISLWKDGLQVGTIAGNIPGSTGSYPWIAGAYIGGTAAAGPGYTVKIKEQGDVNADVGDAPFTLSSPIRVVAPNGGENWQIGTYRDISFSAPGIAGNLEISLLKDGSPVGVIVSSIGPAARSYPWLVGQYIGGSAAAGTGYTVMVKEIGTASADTSDAAFTLID